MPFPGKEAETVRLPISVLKADPKNPRKMDDDVSAGLAVSLETFGPLDIVFNDRTGELVSGHQRVRSLREAGATEVVRDGALGYIAHPKTGDRFPVRFVDWDETKQRMGNLVANNPHLQGEFTEEALDQVRSLEDEAGFAEMGLDALARELEGALDVFDVADAPVPELPDGDRQPFRQMTFTVHDEQFEVIESAIAKAKEAGGGDSLVNENSNGNALAWVCARFNRG